jgi:hypothetical protein
MIRLHIHYSNRTEYQVYGSSWAANLIAIQIMRNDSRVEYIKIVNHSTGAIEKIYKRG